MVAIQHPVLKKQFEQFSTLGSDQEKQAFWKGFNKDFEVLNEPEKEAMREAWEANVANIENRLKAIGAKLNKQDSEISVFLANAEAQ